MKLGSLLVDAQSDFSIGCQIRYTNNKMGSTFEQVRPTYPGCTSSSTPSSAHDVLAMVSDLDAWKNNGSLGITSPRLTVERDRRAGDVGERPLLNKTSPSSSPGRLRDGIPLAPAESICSLIQHVQINPAYVCYLYFTRTPCHGIPDRRRCFKAQ